MIWQRGYSFSIWIYQCRKESTRIQVTVLIAPWHWLWNLWNMCRSSPLPSDLPFWSHVFQIDKQQFEETVRTLNNLYAEAEKLGSQSYLEGCLACLTAYTIFLCMETHYEKVGGIAPENSSHTISNTDRQREEASRLDWRTHTWNSLCFKLEMIEMRYDRRKPCRCCVKLCRLAVNQHFYHLYKSLQMCLIYVRFGLGQKGLWWTFFWPESHGM